MAGEFTPAASVFIREKILPCVSWATSVRLLLPLCPRSVNSVTKSDRLAPFCAFCASLRPILQTVFTTDYADSADSSLLSKHP